MDLEDYMSEKQCLSLTPLPQKDLSSKTSRRLRKDLHFKGEEEKNHNGEVCVFVFVLS